MPKNQEFKQHPLISINIFSIYLYSYVCIYACMAIYDILIYILYIHAYIKAIQMALSHYGFFIKCLDLKCLLYLERCAVMIAARLLPKASTLHAKKCFQLKMVKKFLYYNHKSYLISGVADPHLTKKIDRIRIRPLRKIKRIRIRPNL